MSKKDNKTPPISTLNRLKKSLIKSFGVMGLYFRNVASRHKISGGKKSFKKEKVNKPKKIEKSSTIIYQSLLFIKNNWKIFTILLFFYIFSYFVLAYATPNINLPELFKQTEEASLAPGIGEKVKTITSAIFNYRSNAGDFRRWAQFFLAIIFSLIFIHAIRNLHQDKKIRARDSLYAGTSNLVPFVLNISLFAIQLLPFTIMALIYNIGTGRGLFINSLERYIATIILILSGLITFWFIPSTILGLYAITMPGIYPSRAMAAVRVMVSRRRPEVLRHLIIFILFIFISYILLLLLLVTYAPRFANISLDLFFLISLPLIHTMMYKLYLKLLNQEKEAIKQ